MTPQPEFDFSDPPTDPVELAQLLLENLEEHRGFGLAANQINLPYRVFVVNTKPEKLVVFNPQITWYSDEMSVMTEGCLTYPDLYVKIRRPESIRIKFQNENGEMKAERFNGLISRCCQHELDHLDGIDYLQRAKKFHLDQAKKKMKLVKRKKKRMGI